MSNGSTGGSGQPLDPALRTAWERFLQYDSAALRLKNSHIRLRAIVLLFSFAASLLAVALGYVLPDDARTFNNVYPFVYLLIPPVLFSGVMWGWRGLQKRLRRGSAPDRRFEAQGRTGTLAGALEGLRSSLPNLRAPALRLGYLAAIATLVLMEIALAVWAYAELRRLGGVALLEGLRLVLFALPLIAAGIMAYATKFIPSLVWVKYRKMAEGIRQHIYLYRMKAGEYSALADDTARRKRLLASVSAIENDDEALPVTIFEPPTEYMADDSELQVRIAKAKYDSDNGFDALSIDDYIRLRAESMYRWYTSRSFNEYDAMRRWQVVALIIGGAGSLLAYLGHEAWVAVTTSASVTVSALANLKLYGRTYLIYHTAAADLRNRLALWRTETSAAAPDAQQQAQLVADAEDIFAKEVELWRRQAQDAVAQSEATLSDVLKGGPGRDYIPTDWLKEEDAAAHQKPGAPGRGQPPAATDGQRANGQPPTGETDPAASGEAKRS